LHNSFQGGTRVYDNVSPTISTPSGGGHLPYVAMGWSKSHRTGSTEADKRRHNFGEIEQRVKIGEFNSLSCGDGCGNQSTKNYVAMPKKEKMKIRKLTPKECERLQGFPDDWTKHGIDEKGNQVEMSDTQRYKMCGNALTVNVAREIIQRLFNL
jgi:site-specific DNA-cytosine methylase